MQEISRVAKTGTSRCVIIPAKIWKTLNWREKDYVSVWADNDKLVLTRIPLEKYRDASLAVGGEGV